MLVKDKEKLAWVTRGSSLVRGSYDTIPIFLLPTKIGGKTHRESRLLARLCILAHFEGPVGQKGMSIGLNFPQKGLPKKKILLRSYKNTFCFFPRWAKF